MIFVWRGYGYIALFAGLLPIGTNFILSYHMGMTNDETNLPVGLACNVAAGICLLACFKLKGQLFVHTLWWLPLWFWSGLMFAFGIRYLGVTVGLWK